MPDDDRRPRQAWPLDFRNGRLRDGRTLRVLTIVEPHTRWCVIPEAIRPFSETGLASIQREVEELGRPLPGAIRVDDGSESTPKALDARIRRNEVELVFSSAWPSG